MKITPEVARIADEFAHGYPDPFARNVALCHEVVRLRAQLATAHDALHLVREYPDFDHGGILPDVIDAALRGERHPSLDRIEALAAQPSA